MKKAVIIITCLLFLFSTASCDANQATDSVIPYKSGARDGQSNAVTSSDVKAANTKSGSDTSESDSEDGEPDLEIPSDVEVTSLGTGDRTYYHNLQELEDRADIIVRAVVKGNLGQEVSTLYDVATESFLPITGYTKREIEITQVYKGDVNVSDKPILHEGYYIWTYPDGNEQFISSSWVKPMKNDSEYLLFLGNDQEPESYYRIGDYQGIYVIPTDEIKAKVKEGTVEPSELDLYYHYEGEFPKYLLTIYKEVIEKYFN